MEYVILAAGVFPKRDETLKLLMEAQTLVCCDGAIEELLMHREPHFIVGDMDSIQEHTRERFAGIIHQESEQESNDLTKAVRFTLGYAQSRGDLEPQITILGATGKREDHTLGNIALMMEYIGMLPEGGRIEMVTEYGRFIPLQGDSQVEVGKGVQLSIFAADPSLKLTTTGVQYPTEGVVFDQWSWWKATLNLSTEETVTFKMNHPSEILLFVGEKRKI